MRKLLFLIIFVCSVAVSYAQKPVYVYFHDHTFHAFLTSELDSMRVSSIDVDSLEHANYVVQEFWTADSVYRYPIAEIDSIGFTMPETVFKEDAVNVAESLEQYVVRADDSHIYLKLSTPSYLVPSVGQKLAYAEINELFPYGFAGEVERVTTGSSEIDVCCQHISLDQVFETFYYVVVAKDKEKQEQATAAKSALRTIKNGNSVDIKSIHIPSISMEIGDEISKHLKKNDDITVSGSSSLKVTLDNTFDVHLYIVVNCDMGGNVQSSVIGYHDITTSSSISGGISYSKDHEFRQFCVSERLPYGFELFLSPGVFFNAAANLVLEGDVTQHYVSGAAFEFSSIGKSVIKPRFDIKHKGTDYNLTTTLDGTVGFGAFVELGLSLGEHSVDKIAYHQEIGVEFNGSFVLHNNDFNDIDRTLYKNLRDSKIVVSPYIARSVIARVGLWEDRLTLNKVSLGIPKWTFDIVPTFDNTKLTHTKEDLNSLDAYTELRGNCLFPIEIGYKLFDNDNNEVADYNAKTHYTNKASRFEHTFNGLSKDGKYTLYPKVVLFGHDIIASPKAELKKVMPKITDFKVTSVDYSKGEYLNNDHYYDYRFNTSTKVEVSSLDGISDWGYVYKDPSGNIQHISLIQYGTSYTDTSSSFYRNESSSTACLYPYAKYNEDDNYYYSIPKEYKLKSNDIRDCLIRLYYSTNGDNWRRNDNWCSDKPITEWYGVSYDSQSKSYIINLEYNNLVGSIDLSDCTALMQLNFSSYNHISSIDVSGCIGLTYLKCTYTEITNLNASNCTALSSLVCVGNSINSLNASNCTALTSLSCYNNQLTNLNVSNCTALTELSCYNNQLTNLDVSNYTALTSLSCYNNQLTNLDVSNCTALTKLSCYENQLTALDVSKNTALTSLSCYNNQLTALDVSKNTALTELSCGKNQLTNLDVSNCTALTSLSCYNNQLTALDVSKNTVLTDLSCSSNPLTTLDISKNTALTSLWCNNNQLTALDVSNHTILDYLYCNGNQLENLNISGCTGLDVLECQKNQLTSLDLSVSNDLRLLRCDYNKLTSLNVSKCPKLIQLDCYNNQLTSLDVSVCTKLVHLFCDYNKLTSLNLSGCTKLMELFCQVNQLTSLDVTNFTNLYRINCASNKLTSLEVSGCTALKFLDCRSNYINQVIDGVFLQIEQFYYDQKYYYGGGFDAEYGWWYPGEPEKGYHGK